MLHVRMKNKISKEYLRGVRKVAVSKLNGGNLIQGINIWAVSLISYAGGIMNRTKKALKDLDIGTTKILMMNRALNPRDCAARLYIQWTEGVRGLISAEDCFGQARM